MDIEARQILHDERTGDSRSYGSNIHMSSQSRKVSIGVMADSKGSSAPKRNPKASTRCEIVKGDGAIKFNTERATHNNATIMVEKSKVVGVVASSNMKEIIGGSEAMKRSLISKSFYQRTSTSEAIIQANQVSNLLVPLEGQDKADGIEFSSRKNSVQLFSNQTSIFPSSNYNQKMLDGDTSRKKGMKDGTIERVEEFTFTTGKEVLETDKNKPEDKINTTGNRTENLRMKLCQILGAASSPKSQHSDSHNRSVDRENLPVEQCLKPKDNKFVKTRDNSDTIETDSETTAHTRKRPVTRSRRKKKVCSRKQPGKGKNCSSSKDKEDSREKDIFSFREKLTGRRDAFPNDRSSMFSKKKGQGKSSNFMPHKICFAENDTAEKLYQDTPKTDQPLHVGETFSPEVTIRGFNDCLPDHETVWPQKQNINPEKELHQPATVNNSGQNEEQEVSESGNEQEYRSCPVEPNITKSQENFQSPTFQFKTPLSSSPSLTPKADQKSNEVCIPASTERRFSLEASRYVMNFKTLEPDFFGLSEQRKSSDVEEADYFAPGKNVSFVDEKEEQDSLSDSSSEDMNFSACEEGLKERETTERNSFMFPPIKRLCKHQGIKFSHCSPASLSSKGTGDIDWIDETSEQNQDGFVRAVELFAMELGKIKRKVKSMTNHKSSEILKSVSEEIDLQLQNVHSKIQTDIGKLTSLSKSKRKRLESKFEDQQKQLRLICNRFKEEVNLHLQDCRSTIEDLEADQIEIKGTLEKQRVAHTKLLTQVEEAVEIQLNDAQRKITTTHEMAREKLLQLKRVIAMCLKEGILN